MWFYFLTVNEDYDATWYLCAEYGHITNVPNKSDEIKLVKYLPKAIQFNWRHYKPHVSCNEVSKLHIYVADKPFKLHLLVGTAMVFDWNSVANMYLCFAVMSARAYNSRVTLHDKKRSFGVLLLEPQHYLRV